MKSLNAIAIILLAASVTFTACKKEESDTVDNGTTTTTSFSYTNLSAAQSTINVGTTTDVTATATGSGLTYTWSSTAGTITGSGAQISYFGCCIGSQTVTCKVSDGTNTQSKDITITVQ